MFTSFGLTVELAFDLVWKAVKLHQERLLDWHKILTGATALLADWAMMAL